MVYLFIISIYPYDHLSDDLAFKIEHCLFNAVKIINKILYLIF